MDYFNIENNFTDYILQLLGPNEKLDKIREDKFNFIKNLIITTFEKENSEIKPHVFCFGSFPLKTYLQDSDLDICVIFEDLKNNNFIINSSFDFTNKMLILIQNCLEFHNMNIINREKTNSDSFSDINLIFAEIKLLKCKFGNLSIDISINNFGGLSKLIFMDFIEQRICDKFNSNYNYIFKRSMILIKAWAYHEGGILGSSISLMGNYALEVLVIYVFNNCHYSFKNEIEAFFTFFKILKDIKWESQIIHLFGLIDIEKYLVIEDFELSLFDTNSESDFIIQPRELFNFSKEYEIFKDMDKMQFYNTTNKKSVIIKNMNIIDPIISNNNLGKSINFHNFSKINRIIEFVNNDIEKIILSRNDNNCDPLNYLNSLLKLFSKPLTMQFSELFFFNLPQPKIIINPFLYQDESLHKNSNRNYRENEYDDGNNNFSSINENMKNNFNKEFKNNSTLEETKNNSKIYNNKNNFQSNINKSNLLVTKEILDFISSNKNKNNNSNLNYIYPAYYENGVIEDFLKKMFK